MNAQLKYECPFCGELHEYRHQAQCCCPLPEIWLCDCGLRYSNEEQAEECCRGKQ
jgi:hypothetical protein